MAPSRTTWARATSSAASSAGASTPAAAASSPSAGSSSRKRGAVGLTSGEGYIKRYQYDACGATDPPPYYPTTGVFIKNRFYELDPTRFNVAGWYAANQN